MKTFCRITVLCLLLLVASTLAQAQTGEETGRDPAFEQEILDRLAGISPAAVPIFQRATEAMDAEDLPAAQAGYEQVLKLAPAFPDAARRLSYVEGMLGDTAAALRYAEKAFNADPTPINESALGRAMVMTEDPALLDKALVHVRNAADARPDDASVHTNLLIAGVAAQDLDAIRRASESLARLLPENPLGHYFIGLIAAADGKWIRAERELLLAQKLGWPAAEVQAALDGGIHSGATRQRWLRAGIALFSAWLIGGAVLFGVGAVLSKVTLATAQRTRSGVRFEISQGERRLRALYRVVIAMTSLYFYVSIPLLIVTVVGLTGAVLYLFLVIGSIPIRLAVALLVGALLTLLSIVRSIFTRLKDADPGRSLSREEAPRLWDVAERVAERLDTRPIDAIYLTPFPEIGVTERGRLWKRLKGEGQRCLVLGLGAMPGMTQGGFQAVLAHEYGHFTNKDTAGGDLARQVRASIDRMAYSLARTGQARWYNPAWLFVNGFLRLFLRITLGASRLQEILADRYAAMAYGAANLIAGLKHVIRQNLAFRMQVDNELEAAGTLKRHLQNLYTLPEPEKPGQLEQLETEQEKAMVRPTSPYSSHPAPGERIALLEQLPLVGTAESNLEPAWALLSDPEALQAEMTQVIEDRLERG